MAFASQWTLTKGTQTTAVLGSQNSALEIFHAENPGIFAAICLSKGAVCCSSLKLPSPHPSSFTRVLLATKAGAQNIHFLLTEIPWFHHPPLAVTARTPHRKPRSSLVNDSLRTASCLGNHNKHFNLFKQGLQTATHVRVRRARIYHPTWGTDRSVYCHSYNISLEHCVLKPSTPQKPAEMGSSHPIQINFYLTMGFQTIPGMKVQH